MKKLPLIIAGIVIAGIAGMIGLLFLYAYTGGGDYTISLPGNYSLVRAHSDHVSLCKGRYSEAVVEAPIDSYAIYHNYIIGHAHPGESCGDQDYGYFIVNIKFHSIKKQLTYKQWSGILSKKGIPADITLKRPSRPMW